MSSLSPRSSSRLPFHALTPVGISPRGVVVENRGRQNLTDIKVSIKAAGNEKTFDQLIPALAAGGRKELPLSGFKTGDNVALNPMFIRPQQITLVAIDEAGKDHKVRVPWK